MSSRFFQLAAACCLVILMTATTITPVVADTPANCTYSDYLGYWMIMESSFTGTNTIQCTNTTALPNMLPGITLIEPDIAKDDNGKRGNWSLIYNRQEQLITCKGVEIWINNRIYFAFSAYNATASFCDQTVVGWAHDMDGSNWNCYQATKEPNQIVAPLFNEDDDEEEAVEVVASHSTQQKKKKIVLTEEGFEPIPKPTSTLDQPYETNYELLDQVNKAQSMFTVRAYPELEQMTRREVLRRAGQTGSISLKDALPPHAKEIKRQATQPKKDLPYNFDWRNVSGVNYVSPVRDQQHCGSCYAFSSAGMLEARIRIASNNAATPILSTQDVVSCSQYSQGCEGGFPYLVGGKYGRDFGLTEEACYPYIGNDTACTPNPQPGCNPHRWFTNEYYYIGGYYGASTEEAMQEEIMANGPIAVSFMVYDDFLHYSGGVYTHQFTKDLTSSNFNPFHLVNHAVLCVGWGVTLDGNDTPYWIVKNSWGTSWGENGYFRILRGSSEPGGECAIESITVSAIPILH